MLLGLLLQRPQREGAAIEQAAAPEKTSGSHSSLQRRHVGGGDQDGELHDGRDRRQHGAGDGGLHQFRLVLHRVPMAAMVALLEMKPEARPASGRP